MPTSANCQLMQAAHDVVERQEVPVDLLDRGAGTGRIELSGQHSFTVRPAGFGQGPTFVTAVGEEGDPALST